MKERITVFDIEVLNSDPASICSIGYIVLEDLKIIKTYESLIKPNNLTFDSIRYHIHHITPSSLKDEPTFKDVWNQIKDDFNNTILVAHDIQNDAMCLRAAFKENNIPYPTVKMSCTHVLARIFYEGLPKYNLNDLCQYMHIPLSNIHEALPDAYGCYFILRYMIQHHHFQTLTQLHEYYHVPFGQMSPHYYRSIISPNLVHDHMNLDHYLSYQSIVFAGTFKTPKETIKNQLDKIQANYMDHVNTQTRILVIGSVDYHKVRYDSHNRKVKKALELIEQGQDLRIIHENEFLKLLYK